MHCIIPNLRCTKCTQYLTLCQLASRLNWLSLLATLRMRTRADQEKKRLNQMGSRKSIDMCSQERVLDLFFPCHFLLSLIHTHVHANWHQSPGGGRYTEKRCKCPPASVNIQAEKNSKQEKCSACPHDGLTWPQSVFQPIKLPFYFIFQCLNWSSICRCLKWFTTENYTSTKHLKYQNI